MTTYQLNTDISTTTIFLDSTNAENVMSMTNGLCQSDYKFYLSNPILCPPNYRMIIAMTDAQFPNIFPQIVTNINDKFIWYNVSGTQTLVLPQQRYTIATLASYITANTSLTCTVDYVQNKLQFTSTGSSFSILSSSTCGEIIGLQRNNDGTYQTANSFANTLTMPSWFNLSGTPYIFVCIKNITISNLDSGLNMNCIARLDINSPFGYQCFYRPASVDNYLLGTKVIDHFQISLKDNNYNPLCLNGLNIQFTFRVSFVKDLEPVNYEEGTLNKQMYDFMKEFYSHTYEIPEVKTEEEELFGN